MRHKFVDNSISASARYSNYFATLGETSITTNPLLIPQADQISVGGGYGGANRKGWNGLGIIDFDALLGRRLFDLFEVTYNTNCCGFSFQLRNYNLGIRNENQYFFSVSLANIGTFGSLQRQAGQF